MQSAYIMLLIQQSIIYTLRLMLQVLFFGLKIIAKILVMIMLQNIMMFYSENITIHDSIQGFFFYKYNKNLKNRLYHLLWKCDHCNL